MLEYERRALRSVGADYDDDDDVDVKAARVRVGVGISVHLRSARWLVGGCVGVGGRGIRRRSL